MPSALISRIVCQQCKKSIACCRGIFFEKEITVIEDGRKIY